MTTAETKSATFPKLLERLRIRAGFFSQAMLANALKVARSTVSRYETEVGEGNIRRPNRARQVALADLLAEHMREREGGEAPTSGSILRQLRACLDAEEQAAANRSQAAA